MFIHDLTQPWEKIPPDSLKVKESKKKKKKRRKKERKKNEQKTKTK